MCSNVTTAHADAHALALAHARAIAESGGLSESMLALLTHELNAAARAFALATTAQPLGPVPLPDWADDSKPMSFITLPMRDMAAEAYEASVRG